MPRLATYGYMGVLARTCVCMKKRDAPESGRDLIPRLDFYHLQICQCYHGNPLPRVITAIILFQRISSAHLCARSHTGLMQTFHLCTICGKHVCEVCVSVIMYQRCVVCSNVCP